MVYSIGDKIITKKKHPCGNDIWTVVRVGADFKIRCDKCGRVVMLSRQDFLRSLKNKETE